MHNGSRLMGAIYCCTLLQPPLQDMVDAVSMVDGAKSAIDLFGGIYLAEGGRMEGGVYIVPNAYMHSPTLCLLAPRNFTTFRLANTDRLHLAHAQEIAISLLTSYLVGTVAWRSWTLLKTSIPVRGFEQAGWGCLIANHDCGSCNTASK